MNGEIDQQESDAWRSTLERLDLCEQMIEMLLAYLPVEVLASPVEATRDLIERFAITRQRTLDG